LEPTDITVEILKDIRQELRKTREDVSDRIDALREEVSDHIDTLREELSGRIVDSEIRTSTAIADLAGTVVDMTQVLRASHDLRPRVERCELEIAELRRQVGGR